MSSIFFAINLSCKPCELAISQCTEDVFASDRRECGNRSIPLRNEIASITSFLRNDGGIALEYTLFTGRTAQRILE